CVRRRLRRSWGPRCSVSTRSERTPRPRLAYAASSALASGISKEWQTLAEVRFIQATRIYSGNDTPAVDALDLDIHDGEFMVLVGPPGSGKTTGLRGR